MTPDVPAWCREEARRAVRADEYPVEQVEAALHAAYLRGLEDAMVVCLGRASCKSLVGTPRGKEANLCAAAIRALARSV